MAASLWGRVRVVEYLLTAGAKTTLQDHKGRTALDLALPSQRNTNERERRMTFCREPLDADKSRRYIATRLQAIAGTLPASRQKVAESQISNSGLFLNPLSSSQRGVIDYFKLDKRYEIPDVGKAIGRLDRGPLFPVVSAMSGYSHSGLDTTILDNERWTDEVLKLASHLNIEVLKSYASHVEKQLLAYYVSKHVLLDGEFKDLHKVAPPELPAAAKIVVSKDIVCQNCQIFIDQVRGLLSIDLTIKCLES